jgi:glycosyltransferase involved in cell wall biosynthesis
MCYNRGVTRVSLILTVRNEQDSLPRLLDSIRAQTRPPDEIVIADGGSTDNTLEILRARADQLPLVILEAPGANISQGRNAAIRAARGEIIAATDAGVRLDARWLEEIVKLFEQNSPPDVVSGFFLPDPRGVSQTALAATTLPARRDVNPARFLPSSRSVAFRKRAWEQVGGYPEWLDYCEDLIFDFRLRDAGLRFQFNPAALVYFRPRPTLRAFFKQYYQYARGDGKANLWFKRHIIRYLTYLVALPLVIALVFVNPLFTFSLLLFASGLMFFTPYRRLAALWNALTLPQKLAAILWVPVIRVTGDVAKMIGYPVGVAWRVSTNRKRINEQTSKRTNE